MSDPERELLAAIEAGGTKFVCGLADREGQLIDECRIPTTTPGETLAAASAFFTAKASGIGRLKALAIGSFGPLVLERGRPDFGAIVSTPKPGWSDVNLVRHFEDALDVPVTIDTDVNSAGVGELLFGAGRGLDCFCYVTVGTGIGVGIIINGAPHGGANHPEAGHLLVRRAPGDAEFAGICPYHGDCLEGMACGPAVKARWGTPTSELSEGHQAWTFQAHYLAALCANLTYAVRPQRIIIGGGVMHRAFLYPMVRDELRRQLNGYDASVARIDMDEYIVPPGAGPSAGLLGAVAQARRLLEGQGAS